MTCADASSAAQTRRSGSAGLGLFETFLRALSRLTGRRNISATAQTTKQRRQRVVTLLCERECLMVEREKAIRQHRRVSTFDRRLRAITHEIMEIENDGSAR